MIDNLNISSMSLCMYGFMYVCVCVCLDVCLSDVLCMYVMYVYMYGLYACMLQV